MQGNFGIFLDSSPDRWGQTLMKQREAMEARDSGRPVRSFYARDYLIGKQDKTRQGKELCALNILVQMSF